MDPASKVETAAKGIDLALKGWHWFGKRFRGEVDISTPADRSIWTREWLPVEGTHKGRKRGHFWLMTSDGSRYWAQGELSFRHDGTWSSRVNLGPSPGRGKRW